MQSGKHNVIHKTYPIRRSNAIHADRLTPKSRCTYRNYYIVFVCIEHSVCVEHATCCLAFRGSRPVIGNQAYCNCYFNSIRVLVI